MWIYLTLGRAHQMPIDCISICNQFTIACKLVNQLAFNLETIVNWLLNLALANGMQIDFNSICNRFAFVCKLVYQLAFYWYGMVN